MPAVLNGCCVDISPSKFCKSHCLQLVYLVDVCRGYAFIIAIDGSLDEPRMVVGFEAVNYALVFGLYVCSEIWLEALHSDILKVVRNNVARKIILQKKNLVSLFLKFAILLLDPLLIEVSGHPRFCIVLIIKPKLSTCLLVEHSWPCCFANNESWKFLGPIGIRGESIC
jgi:hypothetical protein